MSLQNHMTPTPIKNLLKNLETETYALYLAFRDPRTPWYAKIFIAVIVGYMLSPIDIIPDFIPIIGYFDDILLLWLAMTILFTMVPQNIRHECRHRAKIELHDLKKNWIAGAVIILIWLLFLLIIGKIIWKIFF